jgi:hypothetical protein
MLRLDRRRLLIPLPGDRSVSPAEVRADGRDGANIRQACSGFTATLHRNRAKLRPIGLRMIMLTGA